MAQLRVKLGAAEHLAVHAAETDAAAPQLCHEVFVHLTGQHLLDDLHGGVVGDAQAARKVALDAHFFEHLIDGRAPPCTKTTRTPSRVRVTRSFMTAFFSVSLIMALPPYLMTMVLPWYFWI